jgi:cytidine deaminase
MDIDETTITTAVEKAVENRKNAYAPYSDYAVGSCVIVQTDEGDSVYFTGCNVENGNFTNTIHAEQLAITKAVEAGFDTITALVVATADGESSEPCGLCQQHLIEFATQETPVILQTSGAEYTIKPLAECTPFELH